VVGEAPKWSGDFTVRPQVSWAAERLVEASVGSRTVAELPANGRPRRTVGAPAQGGTIAPLSRLGHATIALMQTLNPAGRLGLVLHPSNDPTPVVEKLMSWARSHGKQLIVDSRDAARLPDDVEPVSEAQLVDEADALISLGGDGTMLGALRLVAQRPVPILGVNLGSLGFLVEVQPHEIDAALDRLETGDFTIEEHSAAVLTDGGDESIAFNDIALASVPGEGAVHASLTVMGRASGRYRCDALVIATPIGSTAYSYAAGGPLVSPMLDAMIVSPVAPLAGISRAAVVSGSEPIGLALLEDSGQPALQMDGAIVRRMQPGEVLGIRLRPRAGLVVRLDPERYQRRSGIKLSLLDLPFLPEEMRDVLPGEAPVALTLDT
jgi:NAD+ kinase